MKQARDHPFRLDPRRVARSFSAASAGYDAASALQAEVRDELLSRAMEIRTERTRILDLGCGTGAASVALKKHFRGAQVVALDVAPGMAARARGRSRLWRRIDTVVADAHHLPFAEGRFDLVFTNLMLQWSDDVDRLLSQVRAVIKPGGLLLASTFGPETLQELRMAWAAADEGVHVNRFLDMPDMGVALGKAGFLEPVMDNDRLCHWHADVRALMHGLRAIGAHNMNAGRARGLTGRGAWRRMEQAYEALREPRGLPATWQVVYAAAWAGDRRPMGLAHLERKFPAEMARLRAAADKS